MMINRDDAHFTMHFISTVHGHSVNEGINSVFSAVLVLNTKPDRYETQYGAALYDATLSKAYKLKGDTINLRKMHLFFYYAFTFLFNRT